MHKLIITDEIMGSSPFTFGEYDARTGEPCAPEMFFTSADCIVHYVLGFQSVAGESEITKDLLARFDSPDIHKEWTECQWEYRFNDSPDRPWHPTYEDNIRKFLVSTPNVNKVIERMKMYRTIVSNDVADFRYAPEEGEKRGKPNHKVSV